MQKETIKTIAITILSIAVVVLLFLFANACLFAGISYTDDYTYTNSTYKSDSIETNYDTEEYTTENISTEDTNTRSIIKEGTITGETDDIDKTIEDINTIIDEYNAVTTDSYDSGTGLNRNISMTIDVEASSFEEMYSKLKDLDITYTYSNTSAVDTTDTITDLEARLNTYKELETQMLEILNKATTVEDILNVQTELTDIRYNIESITAQLKNINQEVDYSTISINIYQSQGATITPDDEWKPISIFKTAVRNLILFAQFLGSVIIWIIVFSPIIALVVVPIIIIKKKKKQSA